ncbi:MAG: geranylgeranyl reductase family protein [Gammaproteobacteria bacterium]|nr:geranylgeranyl reductase family protein [Gammaproteobacteria bacterium]
MSGPGAAASAVSPLRRVVDVLVVGLGPGGGAAAGRAAATGATVLAIDRKARIGEPVQCAEFIPLPLGRCAQDAGVLQQTIAGMKSYLPSGAVEHSPFPGLMVDRAGFDRSLAQRAQAAGAEVLAGTRLLGLDAGTALVATADGARLAVQYRALIAADGPHSPVARLAGLPALPVVRTRQYTVRLLQPYADTDVWLSDEFPGGYGWLFPKGALANVGLGADPKFAGDLKIPLDRLHGRLVGAGLVGSEILYRTGGAIPVGGLRACLVQDSILFVGDAAGLTHPITGAGIAAAVESGEAAGRAAARFARTGDRAVLDGYDEDLRDQYGTALARAVARRHDLQRHWRTPAAGEDRTMRRGWIAFPEYFAG